MGLLRLAGNDKEGDSVTNVVDEYIGLTAKYLCAIIVANNKH